jgi:hypothetical protein
MREINDLDSLRQFAKRHYEIHGQRMTRIPMTTSAIKAFCNDPISKQVIIGFRQRNGCIFRNDHGLTASEFNSIELTVEDLRFYTKTSFGIDIVEVEDPDSLRAWLQNPPMEVA